MPRLSHGHGSRKSDPHIIVPAKAGSPVKPPWIYVGCELAKLACTGSRYCRPSQRNRPKLDPRQARCQSKASQESLTPRAKGVFDHRVSPFCLQDYLPEGVGKLCPTPAHFHCTSPIDSSVFSHKPLAPKLRLKHAVWQVSVHRLMTKHESTGNFQIRSPSQSCRSGGVVPLLAP